MRYKSLFLILFLSTVIISCDKDESESDNDTPTPNNWKKIELPTSTYQGSNLWAAKIDNKLYIGNESNSGQYYHFFVMYDINSNTYSELPTNGSIAAAGYMSKFVADHENLYYFANDGVKFSSITNTWSDLSYYNPFRNGESGCGLINGKIYYIGGRDFTQTVRYYTISTDSWDSLSMDFYYKTNRSAVIEFDNELFVIGGNSEGEKKVSTFDPITGVWAMKGDCPYSTNEHAVVFQDLIYIIGNNKLYSYDPLNDKWNTESNLPDDISGYNSIPMAYNSDLYLVGYDKNTAKIAIYKFIK